MALNIASKLLSLLRDPVGLGALELQGDFLVNTTSGRRYPVVDSIPSLVDQSDLGPQNLKIQKMYQWMAHGFDVADRIGNLFTGNMIIKYRRLLAERLALKPGDRCLYTSIGTGLDLPYLAERTPLERVELVGLDLSMEMLRKCKKKTKRFGANSMLVQANAERLPFADGVFDIVWHVGGINLFDRPAMAVGEMARVAKAGSLILYADETKKVVEEEYKKKNPFTRAACKDISSDFDPRAWVPQGVTNVSYEEKPKGKWYTMSFRTAG